MSAIYFYSKNEPYYEFSNYYIAPTIINNQTFICNEQYFQSQKFNIDDKIIPFNGNVKCVEICTDGMNFGVCAGKLL